MAAFAGQPDEFANLIVSRLRAVFLFQSEQFRSKAAPKPLSSFISGLFRRPKGSAITRSFTGLYREERLSVRKRGGRKRALGIRVPMAIPQDQNLRWSLDFVMDTLVSGRRFRTQRSAGNRRSLGGVG